MISDLSDILNWRRINSRITTSGQPSEDQLAEIKRLGVTHVVNLGPHSNKGALDDEAGTVTSLGMEYVYIPVEFDNPTDENYNDFKQVIDDLRSSTIHVHCIYNARVSAFFYRYAKSNPEASVEYALANMESIWRPGDDWADFIGSSDAKGQPNRYAGDDY